MAFHLAHVFEAGLAQPLGQPPAQVVADPLVVVEHRGEPALEQTVRRPEVEQVEAPPRRSRRSTSRKASRFCSAVRWWIISDETTWSKLCAGNGTRPA